MYLDVAGHIRLDRLESRRAQHIEQIGQGLGSLQELGGSNSIALGGVDWDVGEAFFAVEICAAGGVCCGHGCGVVGLSRERLVRVQWQVCSTVYAECGRVYLGYKV